MLPHYMSSRNEQTVC